MQVTRQKGTRYCTTTQVRCELLTEKDPINSTSTVMLLYIWILSMCHNSSPPASLIVYVEQSNHEWLLLAVQLPHEVCTYSAWGPLVLPRLPFHSLREQVISCFVHWSKQANGVVNVLHGWEGEKTVDCKRDRDTHMRARVHIHTHAHTYTHTHTSHMHRDVHMHKPHLSAVQLPKPVVPLLQPLSQCSENEATTASGIKLFTPLQNSLRML